LAETESGLFDSLFSVEELGRVEGAEWQAWYHDGYLFEGYTVSGADAILVDAANVAANLRKADALSVSADPEDHHDAVKLREECIDMLDGIVRHIEDTPLGKLQTYKHTEGVSVMTA
jgi:hypothetical protein